MTFDQSTEPDLVDRDFVVEASNFKEANRITTDLLKDVEEHVHEKSGDDAVSFEQMSRTLTAA